MSKKKEVEHIDLNGISNPEFLQKLDYKQIDVLCEDIRKYLLDCVSKNGGHLSSNLGVVEATVALCKTFDFSKDKIIFDVGHQCYTYKLLTGRKLDHLRQKGGVSGFQKINESPYDHYEAGHSSTSISAANGMAVARDLNKENYDVIAFVGDSSVINGVAFEGLNNINDNKTKHKVIIVLNDNDMSISQPVGGVSRMFRRFSNSSLYCKSRNAYSRVMNKTRVGKKIYGFTASIKNWFKRHLIATTVFDNLGYAVIGPIDGHNVKKMADAFEKAKKMDRSVIVYLRTLKGKGYSYAENDTDGTWHGVGKFNVETGEIYKDPNKVSWSKHYADILDEQMAENEKLFAIVPGTSLGSCLDDVLKKYPKRSQDVGIAEEHAAIFAGGLAISGYHPVISMYSTFLQRAYDEISHDIARLNSNATILIDRSGLVGQDGNTHQGIYDTGYLYTIPNTVITMATNNTQSRSLFKESTQNHGVFCIRYPRGGFEKNENPDTEVKFGEWIFDESKKAKTAVISVGPNSEKLEKIINEKNLDANLIKAIYLKPLNIDAMKKLMSYEKVVVYDSYSTINGFASFVGAKLIELGYQGKVILKAIPDTFVDQASVDEQLEMFGLLPSQIAELL